MRNWLQNKITSFILALIISVASFGFFVSTASATIATDLAAALNVPTSILSDGLIAEIPADFFPPTSHPDQVDTILNNIVSDTMVQGAVAGIQSALQALDEVENRCAGYSPFGDCHALAKINESGAIALEAQVAAAEAALASASNDLIAALILARNNQNSLIETFRAKNQLEDFTNNKVGEITNGQEAQIGSMANQAQADVEQSAPSSGPTAEMQEAARQKRENASAWLTDDSLNIQMQQACVLNPFAVAPMNLTPCIANIVYSLVYRPTMYALMGSAFIFDKFLDLSIDSSFVNQPFIDSSWTVIRDFANMLFIFILLYTGIMTIFGATDWRKTILQVVFIALVINFSLFFTKVIIDAGNILAVGVRSAIASGGSISEGIAAGFQPQKFISYAAQGNTSGGDAIIVFLVSAIVTGFAAYIFFMAAILFVRRLVVFWALMIMSPFAFIATAVPGKSGHFHDWLKILTAQAFVAPVFLFFIYIIMKGINSGVLDTLVTSGAGWFNSLIGPAIIAMLLIKALQEALKFAEGMAGTTGNMVSSLVSGGIGLATGGTASLVGMGLRKGVGGYAARKLASGTLAEGSASEKAAQWATRASFDVRSAPLPSFAAKGLGSLGIKVGKAGGAGGVEKEEKERLDAALKAAGAAKANVFQEQGVYSRVQSGTGPEIAKHQAEIATARAVAETASGLTAQLKAQAEAEKKADDDSSAAVKTAKTNYDAAVKGGNQELINDAKDALEKAESSHAATGSSVALQATLAKLEEARKAEKEAVDALDKVAKKTVADIAKEAIAASNEVRKEAYADVVGSGGIFIGGEILPTKANALAAAKIRAGEKASKKTVKELLDEALKETGEKKEEGPKAEAKH